MTYKTADLLTSAAIIIFLSVIAGSLEARESDYQIPWCAKAGGVAEYRLPDKTRIDCLTSTHAIEFDWAKKWAEAIGQSLYYSSMTGKKAGIVLIYKRPSDSRYKARIDTVLRVKKLDIDVWVVE